MTKSKSARKWKKCRRFRGIFPYLRNDGVACSSHASGTTLLADLWEHALTDDRPYRRGVGVMLLNAEGKVFVGSRIDNTDEAWQMPQGGIDEDEEPWATALRELEEETGIAPHLVERIAACPERLKYDLPEELRGKLWRGRFKGQDQDWYLARFLGTDSDIDIATKHPEFREWKWIEPEELPELIVPFKRDLYRRLLEEFSDLLG